MLWFYILILISIKYWRGDNGINNAVCRGLFAFFVGTILGVVYPKITQLLNSKRKRIIFNLFLCLEVVIVGILFRLRRDLVASGSEAYRTISIVFWMPVIFLTINGFVFAKIYRTKLFRGLGNISFSMYILHFPIQTLIDTLDKHFNLAINYQTVAMWTIYSTIVILISAFSYIYIEKPARNWLQRLD